MAAPKGVAGKDGRHVTLSSKEMDFRTPEPFLALVRCIAAIHCDPATSAENPTKAQVFFDGSEGRCGLANPWPTEGLTFVNSRYGRFLSGPVRPEGEVWKDGEFVGKGTGWGARIAAHEGETIALLPVRVETDWWQRVDAWADWRIDWNSPYFGRRISFVCPKTGRTLRGSNLASAVFYRGPRPGRFLEVFARHGRPVPGPRRLVDPGSWTPEEVEVLRTRFGAAVEEGPPALGPRVLGPNDFLAGTVQLSNKGCPAYYTSIEALENPESPKRCGCPKGSCWYEDQLGRRARTELALTPEAWRTLMDGTATLTGEGS